MAKKKVSVEEQADGAVKALKQRLTALVDYWRRVMGLGEWEILVGWQAPSRNAAEITSDEVYLQAKLQFNVGNILTRHSASDTEDLVVHELVHPLLHPLVVEMDRWIDTATALGAEFGLEDKKQMRRVVENVTVRVQRAISTAARQGVCGSCLG